ncbi:hypothetical protein PBCV1_a213aL [Paramecium bursaria Chlorella virus 1]|uniref:Uncharacterized protein n=1 Tax=Paramecium bursaria Chlorella virus 1 TaxID=10506 RepID=F8TTZ7_PBCV1|nr:hypothetical protein PBCV1_a213aL [Paramecium bursaria Chlorella virus 1]AEI70058.1 hypothetical protein [Paramecium bursaria Chlorella virus 1]
MLNGWLRCLRIVYLLARPRCLCLSRRSKKRSLGGKRDGKPKTPRGIIE